MNGVHDLAVEQPGGLATGRVTLEQGGRLAVTLLAGGEVMARRAASCLLEPVPGDRVVVCLLPEPFVLAVLERHGARPAEVVLYGDATVRARGGRLTLTGDEGVRLTSRKVVELLAGLVSVKVARAELFADGVDAVGRIARASFEELGVLARACDRVAERVTERVARVYRFVGELDQLRARHLDYRAEEAAQLKGKDVVISARQVAKIDGEQIHVG